MKHLLLIFINLAVCIALASSTVEESVTKLTAAVDALAKEFKETKSTLAAVTNQVMLQQYMLEERTRSSGGSGLKVIRLRDLGTKSYHKDSFATHGTAAIHVHANHIRTVGMGEFSAVLNGIDFKTRHNDYRLYMPHRTDMSYGAVEEVPFPEVPPSVKNEKNVNKAIIEMQEYFRAWRDNNKTHRDFTNYFKPVLCYLEGAWTNSGKEIDEPFASDRHFIDASSWMELQRKSRFVSYSGSKSRLENLATLPTTIMGMINDTIPQFAQFNFRILCHPLRRELPVDRFRVVDDLHRRLNSNHNIFQHERTRQARFTLSAEDTPFKNKMFNRGLIDELMEEIPGRNNYPGHLYDESLEDVSLDWDGKTKKDVSRYHRVFRIQENDAFGKNIVHRGFNDGNFFAAMTNHTKVAAMSVEGPRTRGRDGKWYRPIISQRWTYAIPLEIIYLTPLHNWNPYNLEYKGDSKSEKGKTVTANNRNGQCAAGKELDGINSKNYYVTPSEFFGRSVLGSSADTVRGSTCVLNRRGESRQVNAGGIYVFLPEIADLGSLRVRYPIFPVHDEDSTTWKELDALRELVMDNQTYSRYFRKKEDEEKDSDRYYMISNSTKSNVEHNHTLTITRSQVTSLKFGVELTLSTNIQNGHQHSISLTYDSDNDKIYGRRCDGRWRCPDGHLISDLIRLNAA